jgi:hypothetical protein
MGLACSVGMERCMFNVHVFDAAVPRERQVNLSQMKSGLSLLPTLYGFQIKPGTAVLNSWV